MGELQMELSIGDAAQIGTKRVRKQKTDRQDAQVIGAPWRVWSVSTPGLEALFRPPVSREIG